jgi:hypothetical protein
MKLLDPTIQSSKHYVPKHVDVSALFDPMLEDKVARLDFELAELKI